MVTFDGHRPSAVVVLDEVTCPACHEPAWTEDHGRTLLQHGQRLLVTGDVVSDGTIDVVSARWTFCPNRLGPVTYSLTQTLDEFTASLRQVADSLGGTMDTLWEDLRRSIAPRVQQQQQTDNRPTGPRDHLRPGQLQLRQPPWVQQQPYRRGGRR